MLSSTSDYSLLTNDGSSWIFVKPSNSTTNAPSEWYKEARLCFLVQTVDSDYRPSLSMSVISGFNTE